MGPRPSGSPTQARLIPSRHSGGIVRSSSRGPNSSDQDILPKRVVSERRNLLYGTPKILVAKIAPRCEAFLDADGIYAGLDVNCVARPRAGLSLEFLCGYLNSNVFMFFYEQLFGALRMSGGYYQFQAPQLRVMPVPQVTADAVRLVEQQVHRVVALAKSRESQPELDRSMRMLDVLFTGILGLSEDELLQLISAPQSSLEN